MRRVMDCSFRVFVVMTIIVYAILTLAQILFA
jgi:hypothetical protein